MNLALKQTINKQFTLMSVHALRPDYFFMQAVVHQIIVGPE